MDEGDSLGEEEKEEEDAGDDSSSSLDQILFRSFIFKALSTPIELSKVKSPEDPDFNLSPFQETGKGEEDGDEDEKEF